MGIPTDFKLRLIEQDPTFEEIANLFPKIAETTNSVFNRTFVVSNLADRVVLTLGHVCMEDFDEIMTLCAHGFGIGGFQILRSLYERTVTMGYIAANPSKADTFLDYQPINEGKFLEHARNLGLIQQFKLAPEKIALIDETYAQAKSEYQQTVCKKCGSTKTQFSWSNMDLRSIAKATDQNLAALYIGCYIFPTLLAHATVPAVVSRIQLKESGGWRYKSEAQGKHVHTAIIGAYNLMIHTFDILNRYFRLGFESQIQERMDELDAILDQQ